MESNHDSLPGHLWDHDKKTTLETRADWCSSFCCLPTTSGWCLFVCLNTSLPITHALSLSLSLSLYLSMCWVCILLNFIHNSQDLLRTKWLSSSTRSRSIGLSISCSEIVVSEEEWGAIICHRNTAWTESTCGGGSCLKCYWTVACHLLHECHMQVQFSHFSKELFWDEHSGRSKLHLPEWEKVLKVLATPCPPATPKVRPIIRCSGALSLCFHPFMWEMEEQCVITARSTFVQT